MAGTGLEMLFKSVERISLETPYGFAFASKVACVGKHVFLMYRHGVEHTLPPHSVNYRANMWSLRELGVKRMIATSTVGSMNRRMKPGDYVVVDQFIDFTKSRRCTFHDGQERVVHTDMSQPYDRRMRRVLLASAKENGLPVHDGGVYVCTEGPRYETPAEIEMFRRLGGDVVGMTGVPEVVLANELGIAYASLAIVTNWAAGIQKEISHQEVSRLMKRLAEPTKRLIEGALSRLV